MFNILPTDPQIFRPTAARNVIFVFFVLKLKIYQFFETKNPIFTKLNTVEVYSQTAAFTL